MAEEKKMFIPANKFEVKPIKKINMAPPLPAVDEEAELDEGMQRVNRQRAALYTRDTNLTPMQNRSLDTSIDSQVAGRVVRKLRKGGARKSTIRGFINTDKSPTPAANKAFSKFNAAEYKKHKELQATGVNPNRLGFRESIELSEGSGSSQKIRRAYKSGRGNVDRSTLDKMSALANRRALRGGASPEDVKNRMNDPKANVRSLNGLMNFHDTMRTKGGNKRRIAEGSRGDRKAIRVAKALMNKGHTFLGAKFDSDTVKSISDIRREAGMDPRVARGSASKYRWSDKEYDVMTGHAKKRRDAMNAKMDAKRAATNESRLGKTYKKTKKTAKRVVKKLYKTLSTPRDAIDIMNMRRHY
jgi:hypothetical protein